ncbi:MAG: hypothetical protein IJN88_10125, partial [Clostridia bacterium]|nr:hypothetical protein [Clostridia bacterium]
MNNIIIENSLIRKELHLKSERISGYTITNKAHNRTISSLDSTEEFILLFKYGFRKIKIKSSDLRIKDVCSSRENEISKYAVTFRSFPLRDSKIEIKLVYLVNDFRCYIRKYLELRYESKGRKDAVLDSISFENLVFDGKYKYWSVPKQNDSETKSFPLSLGQPVYVDAFYFGCEFPVSLNLVDGFTAKSTYYSGKKLSELIGSDAYISHRSVVGGADSDIREDVQKSFFEDIKDISKPVYLRRQYNSW